MFSQLQVSICYKLLLALEIVLSCVLSNKWCCNINVSLPCQGSTLKTHFSSEQRDRYFFKLIMAASEISKVSLALFETAGTRGKLGSLLPLLHI